MIDQILVITKAGIVLFYENLKSRKTNTDSHLIAGFFAALTSFSEEVYGAHIQTLAIPGQNILFYSEENQIVLILVCDGKIASEALYPLAQRLYRLFITKYGVLVTAFPFRVRYFHEFHEDVEHELAKFRPEQVALPLGPEMIPLLSYLQRTLAKNLDRVLHAIVTGLKPVACIGNTGQVRLAIDTLKMFGIHRKDLGVAYDGSSVSFDRHKLDLVGIPPALKAELPPHYVIVDLKTGRVENGNSSKFCQKLITQIEQCDLATQKKEILKQLSVLLRGAEELAKILKHAPSHDNLNAWSRRWASEEREIIYDILQARLPLTRFLREVTQRIAPNMVGRGDTRLILFEGRIFPVGDLEKEDLQNLDKKVKEETKLLVGEELFNSIRKQGGG